MKDDVNVTNVMTNEKQQVKSKPLTRRIKMSCFNYGADNLFFCGVGRVVTESVRKNTIKIQFIKKK